MKNYLKLSNKMLACLPHAHLDVNGTVVVTVRDLRTEKALVARGAKVRSRMFYGTNLVLDLPLTIAAVEQQDNHFRCYKLRKYAFNDAYGGQKGALGWWSVRNHGWTAKVVGHFYEFFPPKKEKHAQPSGLQEFIDYISDECKVRNVAFVLVSNQRLRRSFPNGTPDDALCQLSRMGFTIVSNQTKVPLGYHLLGHPEHVDKIPLLS